MTHMVTSVPVDNWQIQDMCRYVKHGVDHKQVSRNTDFVRVWMAWCVEHKKVTHYHRIVDDETVGIFWEWVDNTP